MSQPPPPRTQDQPAQQHEPRTQSIPVFRPDTPAEPQTAAPDAPRPAFLSQHEPAPAAQVPRATPPTTAVLPAVGPAGEPQQVPGPATTPPPPAASQSAPAEQPWPQPGPQPAAAPAGPPHSTGPLDIVPGFSAPATPPVPPPAGSTAVPPPAGAPHDDDGAAGPGTRARAAGKALGARLGSGLRSGRDTAHGPDRAVLAGLGLGLAGLALLEWGLLLEPGDRSVWSALPSWSAFATVAAVAALLPLVLALLPQRLPARTAWRIGAAAAAGLAAFWVLIVLPVVASDRGFLLTAAVALTAGAVWLAPGRGE
jgi:hypothetical protein